MKKTFSVFGSRGYIGSFICKYLRENGHKVYGYDIKQICNNDNSDEILCHSTKVTENNIQTSDIIIYLAGLTGRMQCANQSFEIIYKENVLDVIDVINKCNKKQLFIYASTGAILEGHVTSISGGNENDEIHHNLFDAYTLSMYNREEQINKLLLNNNENKPKCIGLRFGTVIGLSPCQRIDLIHIAMLRNAFLYGKINVFNPDTKRGILWNKDLCRVVDELSCKNELINNNHEIYNIVSYNCSISKIANEIACKTGALLKYYPPNNNSPKGFTMDTTKFTNQFKFEFKGDFNEIFNDLSTNFTKLIDDNNNDYVSNVEDFYEKSCRVCNNHNLMKIIDFGNQPLANNFQKNNEKQNEYPLCLIRCRICHHTQLNYSIPPNEMFSSYLYESGTSQTLRNYFGYIAERCNNEMQTSTNGNVQRTIVEIACNDGFQLDEFKKRGWRTIGIDPAINLTKIAQEKGHEIHNGFWGETQFENIQSPDILMGQNVLAHVPNPIKFLNQCYNLMNENTILYLQTSQCNMYQNGEFDTVYHEHLSFFTAHSFKKAAELSNLYIDNIEKTDIHGQSFLVRMKKKLNNEDHNPILYDFLNIEINDGITQDGFYIQYRQRVLNMRNWFNTNVFSKNEYEIVAYGAAAKGMTILNYMKPSNIHYIVDDAKIKHNTYSPGLNLQVLPTSTLQTSNNKMVIILDF